MGRGAAAGIGVMTTVAFGRLRARSALAHDVYGRGRGGGYGLVAPARPLISVVLVLAILVCAPAAYGASLDATIRTTEHGITAHKSQ